MPSILKTRGKHAKLKKIRTDVQLQLKTKAVMQLSLIKKLPKYFSSRVSLRRREKKGEGKEKKKRGKIKREKGEEKKKEEREEKIERERPSAGFAATVDHARRSSDMQRNTRDEEKKEKGRRLILVSDGETPGRILGD